MFSELSLIAGALREQRTAAHLSRQEREERRLEKFRRLVGHANEHSSYYRDIIAERGIDVATCRPEDFPVLDKTLLMANFDRIVTNPRVTKQGITDFLARSKDPSERFLDKYRVIHTSGTSGEVGYFLYSPGDWLRGMFSEGFRRQRGSIKRPARLGRLRFAFYGATGGHFAGVTTATATGQGIASLFVKTAAFEINTPMLETIAGLNHFQPDVLTGYTAALKMLAEKQREGLLNIKPLSIGATGETVTKADMEFLSSSFDGAQVTSAYGCTEHLALGASDPGGDTMTLFDTDLIFEFRDDHSLVTNLFNHTLPLIRYRMSDILIPVEQPDRDRLVVRNLVGRSEKMPTFLNHLGERDFISAHIVVEIFVPGVPRFQMHLTGATHFKFLVVLDPSLDAPGKARAIYGVKAELDRILAQKGMSNVTFQVVPVDDLPVDPRTRKFRLIVDERPDNWAMQSKPAA
jgi:phenylacetate-CoA ligase